MKRMRKLQQPMVIEDRVVFPVACANNDREAGFAFNFNGSPSLSTNEGMLCSFDGLAVTYFSFIKFDQLKLLYEQVRCRWVKFQFIPRLPNDTAAVANYSPFYIIKERDGLDNGVLSSGRVLDIDQISTEPSMKVKNWVRPWKLFQRSIKYPVLNKVPSNVDSENSTGDNLMGLWHGINNSIGRLDATNGPHIWGQTGQGVNSGVLGTMVVTASFCLKGNYRQPDE